MQCPYYIYDHEEQRELRSRFEYRHEAERHVEDDLEGDLFDPHTDTGRYEIVDETPLGPTWGEQ